MNKNMPVVLIETWRKKKSGMKNPHSLFAQIFYQSGHTNNYLCSQSLFMFDSHNILNIFSEGLFNKLILLFRDWIFKLKNTILIFIL